jgi:predicted transcriptional regulator
MPTFSVKLDDQARAKVQLAASQRGVTPHAFMVQAIESAVTRSEEDDAWVARALQARQNLLQTGMGVDGRAVAAYLKNKVRGIESQRPQPKGLEQLLAPRS